MADDSTRTPGSGESIRSVDKTGVKTQVFLLDVGNTGTDYDKIMGSRRLLALFCEYIVAKSKQAVWHEKIVKQIYRLRKENRI